MLNILAVHLVNVYLTYLLKYTTGSASSKLAIWGCIYCTTISASFLFILFCVFQMIITW